jgi:DNA-binding transcriptional regulator YiaG
MTLTMPAYPVAWSNMPTIARVSLIAIAFQVGTGGIQNADYYIHRGLMGYPYATTCCHEQTSDHETSGNIRTPAENLAHIRSILKPSVTELAVTLGVSRQAIYDWQSGKAITTENAARLADLGRAADVFEAHGLNTSAQLLRRPIKSGKALFEIVRDGGSGETAALDLADRIKRELQQRQILTARLSGRKRPEMPGEDQGAPFMDELS